MLLIDTLLLPIFLFSLNVAFMLEEANYMILTLYDMLVSKYNAIY